MPIYLWSNIINERVVQVHYVAIDDLMITTPLKKTPIQPPSGHALVKPVHLC